MKLNLGCGADIKEGFVNIDIMDRKGVDVVMDLSGELPFTDIEYINCQDIIEHFYFNDAVELLCKCYDALEIGGKIYIQTPDLEVLCKRYCGVLDNPSPLQHKLNGDQIAQSLFAESSQYGSHKWCYDKHTLTRELIKIGFKIESIGSDGGQNLLCLAKK